MYPLASNTLLGETSIYTSSEEIVRYMKSERPKKCILGRENDRGLKLVPCREDEPICCDESSDPDGLFCYFYTTVFKKVFLHLPLYNFEKEINVAPGQLHPNSWAFVRVFPSFVPISAICHHWRSFCISSKPNALVASCGCPSTGGWESLVVTLLAILQGF